MPVLSADQKSSDSELLSSSVIPADTLGSAVKKMQTGVVKILAREWDCSQEEAELRMAAWLDMNPNPDDAFRDRPQQATTRHAQEHYRRQCLALDRQVAVTTAPRPQSGSADDDVTRWWNSEDERSGSFLPVRDAEVRRDRPVGEQDAPGGGVESPGIPATAVRF